MPFKTNIFAILSIFSTVLLFTLMLYFQFLMETFIKVLITEKKINAITSYFHRFESVTPT